MRPSGERGVPIRKEKDGGSLRGERGINCHCVKGQAPVDEKGAKRSLQNRQEDGATRPESAAVPTKSGGEIRTQ